MKSQSGFGILNVIMVLGVIALMALGIVQATQTMNATSTIEKAQMGRDSLTNGLLSLLAEESVCMAQLVTGTVFDINLAKISGGVNTVPSTTTYLQRQNISFRLINDQVAPNIIGGLNYAQTPHLYPQFNAYIGSIYFTLDQRLPGAAGPPIIFATPAVELAPGTLLGASVYKGALWANTGRPEPGAQNGSLAMADRMITNNLYIWVKNGKIASCGILKTPEQVCSDDLGGVYNKNAAPGTPACGNVQSECFGAPYGNGYYYLGLNAQGAKVCVPSAAICPANNTVIGKAGGGWTCAPMPN